MRKLLIPIFEGINYQLMQEWMNAGYLPNFKRLSKEGYLDKLQCTRIPYEPAGLVSAFSGMKDREHGILAYFHVHNEDYMPVVWKSNQLKEHFFGISMNLKIIKLELSMCLELTQFIRLMG